jgi:hypothetical protein
MSKQVLTFVKVPGILRAMHTQAAWLPRELVSFKLLPIFLRTLMSIEVPGILQAAQCQLARLPREFIDLRIYMYDLNEVLTSMKVPGILQAMHSQVVQSHPAPLPRKLISEV